MGKAVIAEKRLNHGRFFLTLLFICGALMLLLPLAAELSTYQTDAAEYASIAEIFKPPDNTPGVIAPAPTATVQATEEPSPTEAPRDEVTETPPAEETP